MERITLFSPAKLNLFFRVLKKRDDGFHEIASLMQAISLCDTLDFSLSDHDSLTCSDPAIPTDERNFIFKARSLFRERTSFNSPISIHVKKEIPPEGGLGGGSGNIATTLFALNRLSGLEIEEETLAKWGGELSSDAPFFFSKGTAYATGRGEKVESLPALPRKELYLVKPKGEGLSTPLVYKHCKVNVHSTHPEKLLENALGGHLNALNDLEFPAFALRPELKRIKETLLEVGFNLVAMTGSGTTFFCFGPQIAIPFDAWVTKTSFLSRKENEWYVTNR
ncbi:MAG: 4-(cytidine 5'-diphospho)-2-C-methyl-D-erythritol kinase [Chlamydiia bacterium]|nr:4-(cytidine 5'-diphospho)-2-C-methyl-D-erythritol kinase [Chlamydiia bacterium]